MSARPFDVTDHATWPEVLSLAQVAEIYDTTTEAIRHSLKPSSKTPPFHPAPFKKYPLRWRKADVVRDVVGARKVA